MNQQYIPNHFYARPAEDVHQFINRLINDILPTKNEHFGTNEVFGIHNNCKITVNLQSTPESCFAAWNELMEQQGKA